MRMVRNRIPERHLFDNPGLRLILLVAVSIGTQSLAQAGEDEREKAGAHLLEAEMALQRHEYKKAATEYRLAAEASGNPETAKQATRVAYTYGFNQDALESALRWAELDEESDEALLYVAQLQLRTGDVRSARASFRDLLERGEEPVDERLMALIPFLSEEDKDDAYTLMRRLARPYRKSAEANYAVGVMALQAGDHEEAAERAQRAIEAREDWTKPRLLYARALLLGGERDKAIGYAARTVGDDPHPDPEARLELAIMYLSAGRDDDALSQVNQVLLEQPAHTDALRLMAIINFRLEHLDAAWSDFQDLLSSGQHTMDALYYLARISDYRGEQDRALALYSQVVRGPNAVVSQRRVSGILAHRGETEEALEHLQRFGEKHPNFAVDMIHAQAQFLASQGRYEESLEIYDRVSSYRPDSERVVLSRAEVLLKMGKPEAAIDEYRKAVKRWPDSAMTLNALGYTLTNHRDDYREAENLIRRALKLEPDSAAIIDSFGWVLYRLGEYEKALYELNRAYEMMPDPEIAAHIVEVLWKLDRIEEARVVLEEAYERDPDHQMLEDVENLVFPDKE